MRRERFRRGRFAVIALVVLWLLPGCGAPAPDNPILVLGVDGLEWSLLLPMMRDGRLPNLQAMVESGGYGYLETLHPTKSPAIWTTVVTGKLPDDHGIEGFAHPAADGKLHLYLSSDRRTKAIWNILSDYDRRVVSIGWWMTYPVEEINGLMVAQTNTAAQIDPSQGKWMWKGSLIAGARGQVHPAERQNEMMKTLFRVEKQLPDLERRVFGKRPHPVGAVEARLWEDCRWAFRADATYYQIALQELEAGPPPELTLLYLGGTDVVGHRFWRYMEPEAFSHPPAREQIENFADVIPRYYTYVDGMLGALRTAIGPDATIVVVSDHGMVAENTEASYDAGDKPWEIVSGGHDDAPPGVVLLAGPAIQQVTEVKGGLPSSPEEIPVLGHVSDITPSILRLLDIPLGRDMRGSVLGPLRTAGARTDEGDPTVATHDDREFREARGLPLRMDPAHEKQRLEQLRSLGYLDD